MLPRLVAGLALMTAAGAAADTVPGEGGFRGIWFDLGQRSEYGSKYSGGLGTYTAKHCPLAIYAPAANKTFFVYGGTRSPQDRHLLAMIASFDHSTGKVSRPKIVHDKDGVDDPHDNPSLGIDETGHVWVFVSGRGRLRPGFKYRSRNAYDINDFEQVSAEEFTYPQPWWIRGEGFLYLFTRYTDGRELYWNRSGADGRRWSEPVKLAGMGGHYQVSNQLGDRVVTAFNMHPGGNVDKRTNLYFLQTTDMGKTWRTADGKPLELPLTDAGSPALVHDYQREGRLVYLKDINFDADGNPIILYLTSGHHQPGPGGAPRTWMVAHFHSGEWQLRPVTNSTHNYDMGSLYVEKDGSWRIIGPTEPGPQLHGQGGEIAIWESRDEGRSWIRIRQVTSGSERNHGYVRRPVAAMDPFYAFWADGNPDEFSLSYLYFTNREGDTVWRLPAEMETDAEVPRQLDASPGRD